MSDILKLVGAKIRDFRKEKGISQEELGERAGFHFSYIGGVERGERNLSLTNIAKIADCLDVDLYKLFSYVSINKEVSEKEKSIRDVLTNLIDKEPKEIHMINNIIEEIFDTFYEK